MRLPGVIEPHLPRAGDHTLCSNELLARNKDLCMCARLCCYQELANRNAVYVFQHTPTAIFVLLALLVLLNIKPTRNESATRKI